MFDAAHRHGVVLEEAALYRYQPQTGQRLSMLNRVGVGEVRSVRACFGFTLPRDPDNIRLTELSGGALLDADCHPLSLVRLVLRGRPRA
jgi:xylose dehydrogenase (NAD/NADP)